jgi:methylenetetrahydrofolate reductase (NADPH)
MRIDALLETADRPVFSFEFFPPRTPAGVWNLLDALRALEPLQPDFVSVTYGAGGTPAEKEQTLDIVSRVKRDFGLEAMAHLTCVGATVQDLRRTLDKMRDAGIENVLALRGDPPQGQTEWTATEGGLSYSRELIELIRDEYDFSIGAACFPETHIHATSPEDDLRYLGEKVNAGARFLITQLFYDNASYWDFVRRAREAGVETTILPGIMPITNVSQIKRITELCGSALPPRLVAELEARAEDPQAVTEFGVAYATLQCMDLLANGAPGIHFYTLNRSSATRAILSALKVFEPWRAPATA